MNYKDNTNFEQVMCGFTFLLFGIIALSITPGYFAGCIGSIFFFCAFSMLETKHDATIEVIDWATDRKLSMFKDDLKVDYKMAQRNSQINREVYGQLMDSRIY